MFLEFRVSVCVPSCKTYILVEPLSLTKQQCLESQLSWWKFWVIPPIHKCERFSHMWCRTPRLHRLPPPTHTHTIPTKPEVSNLTRDWGPLYNLMALAEVDKCLVPVNGTGYMGPLPSLFLIEGKILLPFPPNLWTILCFLQRNGDHVSEEIVILLPTSMPSWPRDQLSIHHVLPILLAKLWYILWKQF